ncbi:AH receptor-interacting protein-like [Watersipora subatra]|uniref:AH receptor-interacting protein-like n=1 Tax=Watersipora subatra TaxID=2589382 RepID=UPI00355AFC1B
MKDRHINYANDTKFKFHYVTRTVSDEVQVIDDSRKHSQPLELIVGKKFKYETWEKCLQTMTLGEISSFTVDKKLTAAYPLVAKSLRDIFLGKGVAPTHSCAMTAMGENVLGYEDLNKLMANPEPLEFILEVVDIELAGNYEKDAWAMSSEEKTDAVPKLKEEGNLLYKEKQFEEAAAKYSLALGLLERLNMQEKPGSEEQRLLDEQKVPLLLNYAQCQLLKGDWHQVIQHTTEVLKICPDNVKALYRRAKANARVWRVEEAKDDYHRVCELDETLTNTVKKELSLLSEAVKVHDAEDKNKLAGKLFV